MTRCCGNCLAYAGDDSSERAGCSTFGGTVHHKEFCSEHKFKAKRAAEIAAAKPREFQQRWVTRITLGVLVALWLLAMALWGSDAVRSTIEVFLFK